MREKQKAKQIYGVMERQFSSYMDDAFNTAGINGLNLLRFLERRFDNVVFLLGFADSRKGARQMVRHGHFRINGVKTNIPSYLMEAGQAISWKESDKTTDFFKERTNGIPKRPLPPWLSLDQETMTGQVVALPADDDLPQTINWRLIVEYYSRQ